MNNLHKILTVLLCCWILNISQAQHTVGDTAILYVGRDDNDTDTRSVYILDIENPSEPMLIGEVNQFGSDTGWSADGRYIYIVNYDADGNRVLTLYDVNADTSQVITPHLFDNACSTSLYWSPDGRYMAFQQSGAERMEMVLWDSMSGERYTIERVREEALFFEVVWSPDGRYLALPLDDGSSDFIWDMVSRSIVATIQTDMYYNFRWSPDGHYFVYVDSDDSSKIVIYNPSDGTQVSVTGNELGDVSPDGRYVVYFQRSGSYGEPSSMHLYDRQTQEETLVSEAASVFDSQWSPDSHILTYRTMENTQQNLEQYNIETGEVLHLLWGADVIRTVRWSASSQYVAVVYVDTGTKEEPGTLAVYHRERGLLRRFDYRIPNIYYADPIHWSPVGDYLVADAGTRGDIIFDAAVDSMIDLSNWTDNAWIMEEWSVDGLHLLFAGRNDNPSHLYSYDFAAHNAIALTSNDDWGSFVGWRGTNQNESLIYCGEG